ncbi:MAG: hypothetical protein HOM01_11430 [Kordiimonadaceae bacterium]|jgi:hypothetical protein|nr:hypothetical protein [Kordiimonadaceae bacterium]
MNMNRYIIAVVASFIVMGIIAFGLTTLMADQLASVFALSRGPEGMAEMGGWSMGGYLVVTSVFCYIYIKGREAGDIIEGLKFGAMFGVLMCGISMVNYSTFPFEMMGMGADMIINIIVYSAGGVTASVVYKP